MNDPKPSLSPWPIAITAFFLLFFSGLVTFIVFASTHPVDLVRSDYYEEEIRFQQQLDRMQRTSALPSPVHVAYDAPQHCIVVELPPTQASSSSGTIHLYRPSDARLDQHYPLHPDAQGRQRLETTALKSGLWKVRLIWTVGGQEYYADRTFVLPIPGQTS